MQVSITFIKSRSFQIQPPSSIHVRERLWYADVVIIRTEQLFFFSLLQSILLPVMPARGHASGATNGMSAKRSNMSQHRIFCQLPHEFPYRLQKHPAAYRHPGLCSNTSGTTSNCSKAHSDPFRPKPHWISSSTSKAPVSVQRARNACNHSLSGDFTPASAWMVSAITQAVCWVICCNTSLRIEVGINTWQERR